ncbi:retron system putative HNH endonuclease [Desulfococcaceae bacterium HSG8]|nr:retron system putative HNH endonuclease [Desulfococcaceae bacterium HSG8]
MKYIVKNEEPKGFADWKKEGPENRWEEFQNPVKSEVRDSLVEEQGYICCYCGTNIQKNHNTIIEHLKPKGKDLYVEIMFDYDNLLASCAGSNKDIIYLATKKDDTLDKIIKLYGVSEEEIRSLNPNTDFNHLTLPERIKISKKANRRPEDLHCDARKGDNEIQIHPLMRNCEDFFRYRRSDGEMVSAGSEEAEKTINILGLNAKLCKEHRKAVLDGINDIIKVLLENRENFRTEMEKLITRYNQKNSQGRFEHYCFVSVSYLKEFSDIQ